LKERLGPRKGAFGELDADISRVLGEQENAIGLEKWRDLLMSEGGGE
jgi:hypothetical protein